MSGYFNSLLFLLPCAMGVWLNRLDVSEYFKVYKTVILKSQLKFFQ